MLAQLYAHRRTAVRSIITTQNKRISAAAVSPPPSLCLYTHKAQYNTQTAAGLRRPKPLHAGRARAAALPCLAPPRRRPPLSPLRLPAQQLHWRCRAMNHWAAALTRVAPSKTFSPSVRCKRDTCSKFTAFSDRRLALSVPFEMFHAAHHNRHRYCFFSFATTKIS